ncbi:MAG: DUF1223 domain-containing protein [Accumulibacter sp.]|jgi:hypothetical protein|uniref:DUF1223 domain-containing protein n=1 Tax=Accumulibacter sp. TaxID=2053492 RepID=UPI002FC37DB1
MRLNHFLAASTLSSSLLSLPAIGGTAACLARSGADRSTLIELYTSEGCNSCPPADRWLSGFVGRTGNSPAIVALAFHVDYWDYIGWRDRFGSPAYTARQQARVRANRGQFAYTPQTVVNGRDSKSWRQARVPGELALQGAAGAAGADLQLRVLRRDDGAIDMQIENMLLPIAAGIPAVAYLALYENGLSSQVAAGENSGRRLQHDFVVREWIGPIPLRSSGPTTSSHTFRRPDVRPENAGVAVIVESADGKHYLQSLACRIQTGK